VGDGIAVTGASGFVGRHLVRLASSGGRDVVGLVRSASGEEAVARAGGRPVRGLERDETLARALEGSRAVVHLAQIGAERGGESYEAVNIGLTGRVLEAARRAGVPRVVAFSGLGVARYGMSRRCTNRYFLSKLAAEALLLRSDLEAIVFRPSYIVGQGNGLVAALLDAMGRGQVERPGDGAYRLQPIAVSDAVAAVLAAVDRPPGAFPLVFDLVGPEALSYTVFLERLASAARAIGRPAELRVREVPLGEAERLAREGGFQGMGPDELDCLLCDEVSDASPLVALLGRALVPLDEALTSAVRPA